jgi:hypothetical protein
MNKLNEINNAIAVQLISLDNSMETYLKYSRFYVTLQDVLNEYETNKTNIYNEVEKILTDFSVSQLEKIKGFYDSLEKYKQPFYVDIKPELVGKINNVINEGSKHLISKYLIDKNEHGEEEVYFFNKITDLTNLGMINIILGSTRLYYSTNINNIVLQWGYNFTTDANNYKVYLNIYGGGYSEASISYSNEFYNTSIAGAFGKATIGMNIENDFSIERVFINYTTEYKNNSLTKTLNEVTILDSWGICEDAVDCFVSKNEDYCPYNVKIKDGSISVYKPDSNDLDYYKDSSIYQFTGYYEDNTCTFANYFYSVEETKYEFNSTIRRTV